MTRRSECKCFCHEPGVRALHCIPCCYPDAPEEETDYGNVVVTEIPLFNPSANFVSQELLEFFKAATPRDNLAVLTPRPGTLCRKETGIADRDSGSSGVVYSFDAPGGSGKIIAYNEPRASRFIAVLFPKVSGNLTNA